MSGSQKARVSDKPVTAHNKVVHLYQVRPEMALAHLKRSTGLDFDSMPESLVNEAPTPASPAVPEPPVLTDIVSGGHTKEG